MAYHLQANIWYEWVDSHSNWADGISRNYGEYEVSRKLGFRTAPMAKLMGWWGEDWKEVWKIAEQVASDCRRTGKEQALEGESSP